MSERSYIHIKNVNLFYPSSPYNALSLKEFIFSKLKMKQPKVLIKDVHALKDLTLDIVEGERIGIIGSNGAGKSTLLKAIGGIYPVQSGAIDTNGTIRALFELNLGFDFEATGRENILYRGLLLGENPTNVKAKVQEIIDFADIGEFIDYPVKTYSAGMQIRLAFAISTTIRGDILLLDEIIGAGDAAFFQKARARIMDLISSSKILVFVSHDLGTIKDFCTRVIWLKKGELMADGNPQEVIDLYLESVKTGSGMN